MPAGESTSLEGPSYSKIRSEMRVLANASIAEASVERRIDRLVPTRHRRLHSNTHRRSINSSDNKMKLVGNNCFWGGSATSGVMSRIHITHKRMRKTYTTRKRQTRSTRVKGGKSILSGCYGINGGHCRKVGTEIYMGRTHALAHKLRLERCIGLCENYTITERD